MTKKRSIFEAVQELEETDVQAESQRKKRTTTDAKRAQAAQSQTKVYQSLLECRILLQRSVASTDTESNTTEACNELLATLLQARSQLVRKDDNDDEDEKDYAQLVQSKELSDVLQTEHDSCREHWIHVLNHRHKDLRLQAGLTAKSQFRVLDSSFWQQVEGGLEYEQMRDDQDTTVFDDSKVYQQLLKEFVATTATATAGSTLKKLSKKSKTSKEVDRRASKGRKIRYTEIPKLVNFTFPLSRPNTTNLDQDEWFQSLFGGVGNR